MKQPKKQIQLHILLSFRCINRTFLQMTDRQESRSIYHCHNYKIIVFSDTKKKKKKLENNSCYYPYYAIISWLILFSHTKIKLTKNPPNDTIL